MVTVGEVVRPQGNRGEVVVRSETDFPADRFRPGELVHAQRGGSTVTLTVRESRTAPDGRWVVGFQGVTSIAQAEDLRGLELRIPAEAQRKLGGGRYYTHDLVGCDVTTPDGRALGRVERVELGTTVPLLVVGPREVLIPFAEAICRRVDVESKTIVVDPPEGLVDLNASGVR
jgi:16S rRNA processing protein RimM